mgnify:CR=1 FL=1
MLKTYVSVAAIGKTPEIVKGFIDKNGWPISTIITKPDSVKIYFSYKWYQYHNVFKVKQAVKRFEKRNKWYYKPSIYVDDFTKKTAFSAEQYKKELEEIANTIDIQGVIRCGDVEAITNDDGVVIGYKR